MRIIKAQIVVIEGLVKVNMAFRQCGAEPHLRVLKMSILIL